MVKSLLPDEPVLPPDERRRVEDDVVSFVTNQVRGLPGFLRPAFRLLLWLFDVLAVAVLGRRFSTGDGPRAGRYLLSWSESPLRLQRDFVRLVRDNAFLRYYEHPLVRQRMEAPSAAVGED